MTKQPITTIKINRKRLVIRIKFNKLIKVNLILMKETSRRNYGIDNKYKNKIKNRKKFLNKKNNYRYCKLNRMFKNKK